MRFGPFQLFAIATALTLAGSPVHASQLIANASVPAPEGRP